MSKYSKLSFSGGHSKRFLQKTLKEHDQSAVQFWTRMIYIQSFRVRRYAAWLARQHACFEELERHLGGPLPGEHHEEDRSRTGPLEFDLHGFLGPSFWEAAVMADASPATQAYLAYLEEDTNDEQPYDKDATDPELCFEEIARATKDMLRGHISTELKRRLKCFGR